MKKIIVRNNSVDVASANLSGDVEIVILESSGTFSIKTDKGEVIVALPVRAGHIASKIALYLPPSAEQYTLNFKNK